MSTGTVRHRMVLAFHVSDVDRHDVLTVWGYAVSDPYAISIVFDVGGKPVRWWFARDLLSEGLTRAAGEGDVRIRPHLDNDALLWLELRSPNGHATFDVAQRGARGFLEATHELVPAGTEHTRVNLDELDRLLRAA